METRAASTAYDPHRTSTVQAVPEGPYRTSTVRVLYDLVSAANLRTPQAAYIPYTLSCLMCRLHHLARPGRQAEAWCCVGPHGVRKAAGLGLSDRDAEHGRLVSGAVGPTVGSTVGRGVAELVRHEKRRQRIHRSWRLLRGDCFRGDCFVAIAKVAVTATCSLLPTLLQANHSPISVIHSLMFALYHVPCTMPVLFGC